MRRRRAARGDLGAQVGRGIPDTARLMAQAMLTPLHVPAAQQQYSGAAWSPGSSP
jgi:hypothetical protein